MNSSILEGDCRETLRSLPERHFHCCVSSPPYFGLRDYGVAGQIGLEASPNEFVAAMVDVYRQVWRVLRDNGVAWLNLGDSYANDGKFGGKTGGKQAYLDESSLLRNGREKRRTGLPPKSLNGIPWRVAFALQDDGWTLRDAIVWHKPSPMPGSQRDRCTTAYELIFQLTKRGKYFFDLEAIKESCTPTVVKVPDGWDEGPGAHGTIHRNGRSKGRPAAAVIDTSTPRNVWRMASQGYKESHFATFPVELPLRCIKASTSAVGCCPACGAPWQRITERTALKRERPNELTKRTGEDGTGNHCANTVAGVEARTIGWEPTCSCGRDDKAPCRVLDQFHGAGTTMIACNRLGVDYVGCELNPEYIAMSRRRLDRDRNRDTKVKSTAPAPWQKDLFA